MDRNLRARQMYDPIMTEHDFQQYAEKFENNIDYVIVKWDQSSSVWLINFEQVKGHEQHYTWPMTGQYLPYNVVIKDGKKLGPPRAMFADQRTVRTTMT